MWKDVLSYGNHELPEYLNHDKIGFFNFFAYLDAAGNIALLKDTYGYCFYCVVPYLAPVRYKPNSILI